MRGMMYIIAGLGILSVLTKFIVSRVYKHLIRAAGHMGKSEQPLMKMLLHKFETCYQLKMGVENVEVFVDKYLNSYTVAGMDLAKWEVYGDVWFGITLLSSLCVNLYVVVLESDRTTMIQFLFLGIAVCGIVLIADLVLDIRRLREKLVVEIRDYLENVYKPRLENEVFHKEEMEAYHREYFDEERAQLDELLTQKQDELPLKLHFTREEEAVIEEVLKEYMA